MQTNYRLLLPNLLLLAALSVPAYADDADNASIQNIAPYLANLGAYLGYDLTQQPKDPISPFVSATVNQLLSPAGNNLPPFTLLIDTFLGALPINSLVPGDPTSNPINSLASISFPAYNQESNNVSVNSAIDQPTFQPDPVSQSVLNILSTPSYTYCMDSTGANWTGGGTSALNQEQYPACNFLYDAQVMNNTIGTLPKPIDFFSYNYNQQFLSQLNVNSLIGPLLYTAPPPGPTNKPTPSSAGLSAQYQVQQAANFIRYVTGAVIPVALPTQSDYEKIYSNAMNIGGQTALTAQLQAQTILSGYFTKLRMYAAQSSVASANLYYMLSRRMPQNTNGGDDKSGTSQALSEFTMATWRLYNPSGDASQVWLKQINQASTATVQKEMVTLLAEINYQMYLTRQQQERLLLTNTMLLLQSARSSQPLAPSIDNTSDMFPSLKQ